MLEARNARRRRRGEAALDIERRAAAARPRRRFDDDLRAEIRELVVARNHRRAAHAASRRSTSRPRSQRADRGLRRVEPTFDANRIGCSAQWLIHARFELEELVNRPGTYFNPQTEVLIVVDDSPELDSEIFNMEEYEGADWVLISDEVPVDEHRRDELLEAFQVRHHPGSVEDEDEDDTDDDDELEQDEQKRRAKTLSID